MHSHVLWRLPGTLLMLGCRFILVSIQFAMHYVIAMWSNMEFPSTGHALAAVRLLLPHARLRLLRAINNTANKAKHAEFTSSCPRLCSRRQRARTSPSVRVLRLADVLPPPGPRQPRPVGAARRQHDLHAEGAVPHAVHAAALRLISDQNVAISQLCSELECWHNYHNYVHTDMATYKQHSSEHEQHDDEHQHMLEAKLFQCNKNIEGLARSMGRAVAKAVDKQLPDRLAQLQREVDSKLGKQQEQINNLVTDMMATTTSTMTENTKLLVQDLTQGLTTKMVDLLNVKAQQVTLAADAVPQLDRHPAAAAAVCPDACDQQHAAEAGPGTAARPADGGKQLAAAAAAAAPLLVRQPDDDDDYFEQLLKACRDEHIITKFAPKLMGMCTHDVLKYSLGDPPKMQAAPAEETAEAEEDALLDDPDFLKYTFSDHKGDDDDVSPDGLSKLMASPFHFLRAARSYIVYKIDKL